LATPSNGRDIERLRRANHRLAELWAIYCAKANGQLPAAGSPEYNQVRRAFKTGAAQMK
jgi:hypothetical protein